MLRLLLGLIVSFQIPLLAQKLEPCKPDTPALRLEETLQATGLHVGGVEEFPAGVYKPLGANEDGTFYLYEKPLVAKLMADTVQVQGGLFLPTDPSDDARGWYSMPDGAKNAVVAPEQGVDSAWEGDPTLPASNPYTYPICLRIQPAARAVFAAFSAAVSDSRIALPRPSSRVRRTGWPALVTRMLVGLR